MEIFSPSALEVGRTAGCEVTELPSSASEASIAKQIISLLTGRLTRLVVVQV